MKDFDVCILGAGLAGMHTAIELMEAGLTVCVIDPKGIAGGASGTPVGLANPATGRFANRSWRAEQCMERLTVRLEEISNYTGREFYRKSGVLRPALSKKIAGRMQENVVNNDWAPAMVEWKSSAELEEMHPGLTSIEGGVWVPDGLTVSIPDYLRGIHSYLSERKVFFFLGRNYSIQKKNNWKISIDQEDHFTANKLVICAGIYSKSFDISKELPLHAVKGQTAIMQANDFLEFDHAVSAQGYFSKINDKEFILGSTYEHNFEHEEPDEVGFEFMFSRFSKVQPELASSSKIVNQWAGVRASTPDRKPIIGTLDKEMESFIFAGLGSKGLLYSAYGAELLKEHLLNNQTIPETVDVNRFKA
ncbi:MAG: FAD-binding oxidoreductase [bacterium]|nr:FAD-binding oxidoreductase [bacterium]